MTKNLKIKIKEYTDSLIIDEDTVPIILLKYIEHNREHFLTINLGDKKYYPCARCLGIGVGLITGFIITLPFLTRLFYTNNFTLVFIIAWLFAIPSIIDWSTVKLKLRKGNNKIRTLVGFLHGIGITIYFFVLPAHIIFKFGTYFLYEFIFFKVRQRYRNKKKKATPQPII